MKVGNKIFLIFLIIIIYIVDLKAEQKTTSPLLNIDEIKPSFEILEEK